MKLKGALCRQTCKCRCQKKGNDSVKPDDQKSGNKIESLNNDHNANQKL